MLQSYSESSPRVVPPQCHQVAAACAVRAASLWKQQQKKILEWSFAAVSVSRQLANSESIVVNPESSSFLEHFQGVYAHSDV